MKTHSYMDTDAFMRQYVDPQARQLESGTNPAATAGKGVLPAAQTSPELAPAPPPPAAAPAPKPDMVDRGLEGTQDIVNSTQSPTAPRSGMVNEGADALGVPEYGAEAAQAGPDSTGKALGTTTGYAPAAMQGIGGIKGVAGGGAKSKEAGKDALIGGAESAGAQAASMNPYAAAAYYGGQLISNTLTGDSIGKNLGKLF